MRLVIRLRICQLASATTATMWQGGPMGTRPTAIVSCFGLIGILIALIAGEKSNEAKYFIRQSANATICTILVSTIVGVASAILGNGIFSTLLTILSNIYGVIIFIEILISAINLDKRKIWGIYCFIK